MHSGVYSRMAYLRTHWRLLLLALLTALLVDHLYAHYAVPLLWARHAVGAP